MERRLYQYRIGGLCFRLDGPEFPDDPTLDKFFAGESDLSVDYSLHTADAVVDRICGELLYEDRYSRIFRCDADRIVRVFRDAHTGESYLTDEKIGDVHTAFLSSAYKRHIVPRLVYHLLDIPGTLIEHGGILLHASYIDAGGKAILFTGPKQMGKSTQADLWKTYRGAKIVNGDRALLRRKNGIWYAWGSPFCGTSRICENRELPLAAIVILSQKKDGSQCEKASVRRALTAMLDGCTFDTWNTEQVRMVSDLCGDIIASVPFLTLDCLPDESAVIALEQQLSRIP